MIAYLGGKESDPKDRGAQMARWKAWMDGLGPAMVDPGTPLGQGKLVSTAGVSERGPKCLTGFSVVQADSLSRAVEIAKRCPFIEIGDIEVAEMREMQ
jgi:hypothetical protein